MKFAALIFLVVVVAAAQAAELSAAQQATIAYLRSQCRSALKVSVAQEKEIHDGKFGNLSESQKCFIKCMTDAVQFTDAQSNVNQAALHKLLDPLIGAKKASQVSADCDKTPGKNPCDKAANIYKCHASHKAVFLI